MAEELEERVARLEEAVRQLLEAATNLPGLPPPTRGGQLPEGTEKYRSIIGKAWDEWERKNT